MRYLALRHDIRVGQIAEGRGEPSQAWRVNGDFLLIARTSLRLRHRGARPPMLMTMTVLQVDIVIPVRNEERDLAPSVRRLVSYLREGFPFTARITIADNGSTDGTWAVANRLTRDFDEVRAVRMDQPGRGGRCGPSGRTATPRFSRTWMSTCRQI